MQTIQLHTDMPNGMTMIPNTFLDHYMSKANGEFLKIYLYLLRWVGYPDAPISTGAMADFFNMTENDILRALRFWEQEHLLEIQTDASNQMTALYLHPVTVPQKRPDLSGRREPVPSTTPAKEVPSYSMEDLQDFMEQDEGTELFIVIQEYTGKPLSPTDMSTIFFFYKDLHMSIDLIEHLFEYCISNGHRKMSYIQAVAIGWSEAQIHTVEEAKNYCAAFNQLNTAIQNTFGIKNRYLSEDELRFIRKWSKEFRFSQDIILEACKRTILNAGTASFKYANSILERWFKEQVTNLKDVERLDQAFEKSKAAKASAQQAEQNRPPQNTKKPAARFHNFNQRSYDYGEMEMEFVKKIHSRSQQ